MILGNLEQTIVMNAYNFSLPSCDATGTADAPPVGGPTSFMANTTVVGAVINAYPCTSAPPLRADWKIGNSLSRMIHGQRSNYFLACGQDTDGYPATKLQNSKPNDAGIFTGNDISTRIAEITDGTSNTVMTVKTRTEKLQTRYGAY